MLLAVAKAAGMAPDISVVGEASNGEQGIDGGIARSRSDPP